MEFRNALVVAAEKRREVLRQIFFVVLGERAHDAEVQGDVAAKGLGGQADLDVAGVHVGVEKTVTEHLREKKRHTIAGQLGNVHTRFAQAVHLADGHAVHALHDDDLGVAKVPNHLGDQHQMEALHVAAQLGSIGRFAHQVQLVVQVFVKFGHHLAGLEAFAVGAQALHPTRHHAHEAQVFVDDGQHARTQNLHGHFTHIARFAAQGAKVHLRDRGAGDRLALKGFKDVVDFAVESPLDRGHRNR